MKDLLLVPATINYLEMHNRPELLVSEKKGDEFKLLPKPILKEDYRKLYYGVGEEWNWLDRMVMPDAELEALINASNNEIYLFTVNGVTAGFAEFVIEERYTEIMYFGLLPAFVGKGWGHYFLTMVIQKAWNYPSSEWIQLNTCSLDHPNALNVYQKSGFSIVRTETQQRKKRVG